MRASWLLTTALLLTGAPIALADSIQISANSSVLASFVSPNDNYWGEYSTLNPTKLVAVNTGVTIEYASFSSISLFVPSGALIKSTEIKIILPKTAIQGTGVVFVQQPLPPPDINAPRKAPVSSGSGFSMVYVDLSCICNPVFHPVINGNQVSTGNLNFAFELSGQMFGHLTDGVNWNGYIGGTGQATIPYTVELDVTYDLQPVPEPSTFIMLGTGILGLAGMARRRLLLA